VNASGAMSPDAVCPANERRPASPRWRLRPAGGLEGAGLGGAMLYAALVG